MPSTGIFSGVRIVELAQYVFVPGASVLLADQGAEVIKIETPGVGDPYRTLKVGDGREVGTTNLAMEQNNRGKKSLGLDLKSEEGREALLKLIETADIFITSLRPKAIKGLRLDVEDLRARNPKLIYARGNGVGFRGAEANKPGFDASAFWARGGMADAFTVPGNPITRPRPAFGDHSGAISLAFAMAGALFKRAMTGEPSVVETSLLQTAAWMLSSDLTYSQVEGYKVHGASAPFPLMSAYTTKDGVRIQLMLLDPRPHWPTLCRMLKLDELIDDPRFADNTVRMANAHELIAILSGKIGEHNWEGHWKDLFEAWDAPWELIRSVFDMAVDPQVIENEMIFDTEVQGNALRLVSGPATFDGHAAPVNFKPAPDMGEHTEALLSEVGYSSEQLADLRARKIAQ